MHIPFPKKTPMEIEHEIRRYFSTMAVSRLAQGHVVSIEFVDEKNRALRITNQMKDLEERLEIGQLSFEVVDFDATGKFTYDISFVNFKNSKIFKMGVNFHQHIIDCGLIIRSEPESEFLIAPAVYPYSLFIKGEIFHEVGEMEMEYSDYTLSKM